MSDTEEAEEFELFCANLAPDVTEEILFELFLQAGPVEDVSLPKDPASGRNRGYGFIRFKHAVSVPYSINLMNGTKLFNRSMAVREKNARKDNNNQLNGNNNSNNSNNHSNNNNANRGNENPSMSPLLNFGYVALPLQTPLLYQTGLPYNYNNMPQTLQNSVQNNDEITKHSNLGNNRNRHHSSKPYSRNQSPPRRNYHNDRNDRDRDRDRDYNRSRNNDRDISSNRNNGSKYNHRDHNRPWVNNSKR